MILFGYMCAMSKFSIQAMVMVDIKSITILYYHICMEKECQVVHCDSWVYKIETIYDGGASASASTHILQQNRTFVIKATQTYNNTMNTNNFDSKKKNINLLVYCLMLEVATTHFKCKCKQQFNCQSEMKALDFRLFHFWG